MKCVCVPLNKTFIWQIYIKYDTGVIARYTTFALYHLIPTVTDHQILSV